MENQVFVMDHPLIQHKLTFLRSKDTGSKEFRELVSEIGMLMCYEATRDLPLEDARIETPIGPATTKVIAGRKMAFIPILRAGLGMVDAPEGMKAFTEAHPDVPVYCAAMDERLNDHGYIVPGLGDAGDRIFGTL